MRFLIIYFFIFTFSLHALVHDGYGLFEEEKQLGMVIRADQEPTFNDQVGEWAWELSETIPDVQATETEVGNCLPVAVELQKRIVATGRSALIVAIETPALDVNHALVLYTSEKGGQFDYVIDNGFSTAWTPQPRALLDKGHLGGMYYATCEDPIPEEGRCQRLGLPF